MTKFDKKLFYCATSIERHYVTQPIPLSCGHSICQTCVPIDSNDYKIKCKLCGEINKIKLEEVDVTLLSKQAFKGNIDELFDEIEKQMIKAVEELKNSMKNYRNRVESHIDKVRNQIDDHVELLQTRIDRFSKKLHDELDKYRDEMLESVDRVNIDDYEQQLDNLHDDSKTDEKNYKKFCTYEGKIRKLNKTSEELDDLDFNVTFEKNDEIDQKLLGTIKFEYNVDTDKDAAELISRRLENEKFRIIDKNIEVTDLCILSNDQILVASCDQHRLSLYNKKFELVKTIEKIDNKLFSPLSIATDNDERIYICDSYNQQILMTDLDLNLISQFGKYGNGRDKLKYPNGIFYYQDTLYISDRANNRIVKLTNYLRHEGSFSVEYQPTTIKILNNIACIKSANTNSIYFYDLQYPPYFNFKCQYDDHHGTTISVIKNKFYEFDFKKKKIHCFDENGKFDRSINLKSINKSVVDAKFFQFNKSILMSCVADKTLILI